MANIPTQLKKCRDHCDHEGLEVLKVFTDKGRSARTTDRPAFQQLMQFCREHKGKKLTVVVSDLSRLARNVEDQAGTLTELARLKVKLYSVDEPMLDTTAAGRLSANLLGAINQFYSDSLSERVTYRMDAAIKAGRPISIAPLGYMNARQHGSAFLTPDPQRSPLVRKAFELMATGSYTKHDVLRMVNALGLTTRKGAPVSKQSFQQMMTNPTYKGWVVSRRRNLQVKGTHEPLVDEGTFEAVQEVIMGNGKRQVPHVLQNEDFPLRGFVRCARCDKPLTAGWSKGRTKHYGFYRCWTKGCAAVSVRKEALETDFVRLLGMMQPTAQLLAELPQIMQNVWKQRRERIEHDSRQLSSRKNEQDTLNRQLIEKYVAGKLSQEDFDTLKSSIAQELSAIEEELKALKDEHAAMNSFVEQAEMELMELAKTWKKSGIRQRQEIQNALWPEGLRYSSALRFFEPANKSLMQDIREFMDDPYGIGRGDRI